MKPIPLAFSQTLSVLVTSEMTVRFDELGPLHPVYATYWMAKHFEEAGRKVILPFLEPGEGGLGSEVSVQHLSSAVPGMRLTVTAVFERQEGRRVHADLRAESELGDLIGSGHTVQVVLPQERIDANFAALRRRLDEAHL